MRILLDENVAWTVLQALVSAGHQVDHIAATASGLKNGEVYREARKGYDLFVTNDRDFLDPGAFPPTADLGVVFMQIPMRDPHLQASALIALLKREPAQGLKGRLILLREDGYTLR